MYEKEVLIKTLEDMIDRVKRSKKCYNVSCIMQKEFCANDRVEYEGRDIHVKLSYSIDP